MRIYVDTSVFGGCFDPEFEIWSNRLIDFFKIGKYQAVISEVSEFELRFAPNHVRQIIEDIPNKNIEIAKLTNEAKELSEHYLKEKIVTKKSLADTQHIAVATVQQVDLLVSWNLSTL